jgi:hypothetical protein
MEMAKRLRKYEPAAVRDNEYLNSLSPPVSLLCNPFFNLSQQKVQPTGVVTDYQETQGGNSGKKTHQSRNLNEDKQASESSNRFLL